MSKNIEICGSPAAQWYGVAGMAWLVIGFGITRTLVSIPALHNPLGLLLWSLVGHIGPASLLAISGLRRGQMADRICGALVLGAVAFLVALTVCQQLQGVGG